MRTAQTIEINSALKVVKLDRQKFKVSCGYVIKRGFALHHPSLGYFCFNDKDKDGHILPYTPMGGKKVLCEILDEGGFLHFDNCVWVKEMEV